MATAPPEAASNAEHVAWAYERLNDHDTATLRQLWSDATVERFPTGTVRGADEIAAYLDGVFAAVPDFHMDVVRIVEDGEDVFVRWRMTGHHSGAGWQGIEPTGRAVELDGIDHFVIRDRRVVSNFVVFDQMQFARAIGLMPPDGSTADRGLKTAFSARVRLGARLAARRNGVRRRA